MKNIENRLPWIVGGVGILLLLLIVAQVVMSLPPRSFTFLTGPEGTAFHLAATYYRDLAAEKGFTIEVVPTSGPTAALRMLEEGEGDAAFVPGGVAAQGDPFELSALATIAYDPLWIFYRSELAGAPYTSPLSLKGLRVAIGEEGSAANVVARLLLADYGVTAENTTLLELPPDAAHAGLRDGTVDAVFLVDNPAAPLLQPFLAEPGVTLMSLADAEAISRRHRFLYVVDLPRGTLDLENSIPARDTTLVSTVTNLVIRNDLHPDLIRLLAFTTAEIGSAGGVLAPRNRFPDTTNTDLPVNKSAQTFLTRIQNQQYTFDSVFPFWLSAMLDRYLLFVVPLLLIALPLLSRSPLLYQVYMRSKVNKWYKVLHRIEQRTDMMNLGEVDAAVAELQQIDDMLATEMALPNGYMPNLYTLRMHLDYAARRLRDRRARLTGAPVPAEEPVPR
jgi:TRAP-type uncharacterized transport system substrate-binding protein